MNTHQNITERVLKSIEEKQILPRPRYEFILKNYFFWALGAIAVALGALAFSATLFEIENVDWRLSSATHSSFFSFFLSAAPFVWIIALGLFILIGYINVRRTSHGYRYPLYIIAIGAVLTSIVLGTALYSIGFGGRIDEVVGDHPPFYRPVLFAERDRWLAPEKGLLGGEIIKAAADVSVFSIKDFSGRVWSVDGSDLRGPDLTVVARGGMARIVGVPVSATSSIFHACFVFPWEMHGDFRNNPPPPPLAAFASTSAQNAVATRSDACKNIRPYQQLHDIDD